VLGPMAPWLHGSATMAGYVLTQASSRLRPIKTPIRGHLTRERELAVAGGRSCKVRDVREGFDVPSRLFRR
jgi:hypothetical protein